MADTENAANRCIWPIRWLKMGVNPSSAGQNWQNVQQTYQVSQPMVVNPQPTGEASATKGHRPGKLTAYPNECNLIKYIAGREINRPK